MQFYLKNESTVTFADLTQEKKNTQRHHLVD